MNRASIFILVLIGILIITFVVIIAIPRKHVLKDQCNTDSDCAVHNKCLFSPDDNRKVCVADSTIDCDIQKSLTECDLSDSTSCSKCVQQPPFKCIVVDKDNPYQWKQGTETVKIPDSKPGKGWCLPPVVDKNLCNPATSNAILVDKGDHYDWECLCNDPAVVGQEIAGGNCNSVTGCSYPDNGNIYVPVVTNPPCSSDKDCDKPEYKIPGDSDWPPYCRQPDGSAPDPKGKTNQCWVPWGSEAGQKINPSEYGMCNCESGYKPLRQKIGDKRYELQCVTDSCAPGKKSATDDSCDCPADGYIKCPQDVQDGYKEQCATNPQCIRDPCAPNGHWDPNQGICVCTGTFTSRGGQANAVGAICEDVCTSGGENICSPRGTCVINPASGKLNGKSGGSGYCVDCKAPFKQDSTHMCGGTVPKPDPSSCFTGDSLITMADGSTKRLDSFTGGERVQSGLDPTKSTVVWFLDISRESTQPMIGFNGLSPFATTRHCFIGKNTKRVCFDPEDAMLWKNWSDTPQKLDEGIILHGDTKVSDIKMEEYTGKVYNLITTDHTYVVNGLPVHDDIMEYNKHPRESMLLFEFLQNVLKKTGISKIREERDNNRLPQLLDQEWEMYDFEYNGEDTNNLSSFEKSVRKFFTDMPWLVDAADHLWKVRLLEVKNMLQTAIA